jgi:hypothetical protein
MTTTNNQRKEAKSNARQEESGQSQEGDHESAQGRRGRRRQERLARLIAPWWERDPERLQAEIGELAISGFRVLRQWVRSGSRLVLDLQKGETRYELEYDEDFTSSRGFVTAYSVSGKLNVRTDPFAQGFYPDGARSALSQLEKGVGRYALIGAAEEHLILPTQWRWPGQGDWGSLSVGRSSSGNTFAAIRITGVTEAIGLSESGWSLAGSFLQFVHGLWVRGTAQLGSDATAEAIVSGVEEQIARAHGLGLGELRERMRREIGAVMVKRSDEIWAEWQFVRRSESGAPIVLQNHQQQPYAFDDRAPYAKTLFNKRVAIIGCGAVGWPVATLLARSGVRSFDLFDDDTLHGGNLARIGAFLDSIGRLKVDVLAEQLTAIAPGIDVTRNPYEVGLHVGASALLSPRPDILINLTAEEFSTDETNAAACFLNVPAVFGWVSNNVKAARLFRVRPLETACYECVRQSGPERIPSDGLVPVGTETPWSGSVIDTDLFAAAVAKMAVRTLAGEPTSNLNPDHIVLRYGGPVPIARPVHIPRDPRCPVCRR